MKFNWFALAIVILFMGAMAREIAVHDWKLVLFYFLSAAMNAVIAFMK
ncbi:MAG: hypothetical protein PHX86_08180 [Caldisericia bacterium]|nr:hypothetical protein [Caldisericia bacterium]